MNLDKKFIFFQMKMKKKIEMNRMIKMIITFKIYTGVKIVFTFIRNFSFRNMHKLESRVEVNFFLLTTHLIKVQLTSSISVMTFLKDRTERYTKLICIA